MLIESLKPLRVHLRRNVIELVPGQPIELADDEGERLLAKVPDVVRQVSSPSVTCVTSGGCLQMDDPPKAETSNKPIDIISTMSDAVSQVSLPDGYCRECGSGYWIRQTREAPYQCGRCFPTEYHWDLVYVPGGTPHLTPPVESGWLVTYRDQSGRLCGGADDRAHGTVQECQWDMGRWTLCLTDGQLIPLSIIQAVASTHSDGRIRAAWNVREHGYDGHGSPKG